MALVALDIPKIGLVMENARLVRWLKKVGDRVEQGEPLLELETEKSVVEIESTESGRLVEQLLQVDQEVHVGDQSAWLEIATDGTADATSTQSSGVSAAAAAAAPRSAPIAPASGVVTGAHGRPTPGPVTGVGRAGPAADARPARIPSTPIARRMAAQGGVELHEIAATGPRGRVQMIDVERAIQARAPEAAAHGIPKPNGQPLSSMRRALARSMTLSNATVPQFRVDCAVDWTKVLAQRAPPDGGAAGRPSVNDFLLQAIARALLAHPALNATFSGDVTSADAAIIPARGVHVGLVVAVSGGLLVPVIHDVEQHSIAALARLRTEAVERARNGKLRREDLEGATFGLSNLGMAGPDRFDAIINPPQSAILAVGRQQDSVVARNGKMQIRPRSNLTLTVDHRVADGRLASDFLRTLVDILEGDTWHLS